MPSRAQRSRQGDRLYKGFRLPKELVERIEGYCDRNLVGKNLIAIRALEQKMDELELAEQQQGRL